MAAQGVSGAGGPSKGSNMGVLHTGYLEKYNPANRHTKKRFVVLTHVGLHWFKRESGYDLFGEERGSLNVGELTKCVMSATDGPCTFEVATREERRTFTATSKEEAAAWVNAITTAMRNRSLYRRETLNNLSFLNHGDDSVPNCVMATLKRADGQELVLERSLLYAKTFNVPADNPDDTLAVLLSDGTSAEVTVRTLLTKPVGGDNFPVRVDLDDVVANLLMAVERADDVPRKHEETVMAALLGPDFVAPSVLFGLLSVLMVADRKLTLERGLSLLVLLLIALRPALVAQERSLRGDRRTVLTLCVDDYVVTKRSENDDSDVADLPKRFIDGCNGDMVEAERRWRLTKQWRVEFNTDEILEQEHPYFDDIKKVTAATQAALKDGVPKQEVIMPPLPNMEELDFGTSLNQRFTKELYTRLKVEDYLVKRSPTTFANLDFANRMSEGLKKNTYIIGFDSAIFEQQAAMSKFARVATVSSGYEEATPNDLLVVLSPGVDDHWTRASSIQAKTKVPTLALAPPFSLRYDIGNGKGWEVTYCLKRVTRGWIFRAYPGNWKAYLERPDGKFELLMEWEKQPRLNEVSKLLRGENDRRYGPGGNDRYMTQRL